MQAVESGVERPDDEVMLPMSCCLASPSSLSGLSPRGGDGPTLGGAAILRELDTGEGTVLEFMLEDGSPQGLWLERALLCFLYVSRIVQESGLIPESYGTILEFFLTITESYGRGGQGRHGADSFPEGAVPRVSECHGGVCGWAGNVPEIEPPEFA